MEYNSIADIYSANNKIRERTFATLNSVSPDEATASVEGEKWSIQEIAEHMSMVEYGAGRICAKLLDAAKTDGIASDGSFSLSNEFGDKSAVIAGLKVEAPERVQPTGDVSLAESIERLVAGREAINAMRSELESYELSAHKFPHPFFGDMTAAEWLVVLGGHEARHTKQIERLLEKIRQ